MSNIESKDSRILNRGEKPQRQQPTTSVTMVWNIVNGLKLVRIEGVEDNDPRIILYRKAAAEFFEKYKQWAKTRIIAVCGHSFHIFPNEDEVAAIYQELYYFIINEEHENRDLSSPMILRIQKAVENKIETGKPFASYFQRWIWRACKDWVEKYHPDNMSVDSTVVNEEGEKIPYLDANEISIQKSSELPNHDRWIHVQPSSADTLEVENMKEMIYSEDLKRTIKNFSSQILFETVRIPDDSESSKIGNQLIKELIANPTALEREIGAKYGKLQQHVSYHKKKWIKRKVLPQLKKYQPGHVLSACIGNSIELYRWLVDEVFKQIGEDAPCEILL